MVESPMLPFGSWMATLYLLYTALAVGITACLAAALLRRFSAGLAFFSGFFALSAVDFLIALATHAAARNGFPSFEARAFWMPGLAVARLRFAFLVLYAHSFHRYRFTRALSAAMVALICASALLGFIVYTPVPDIVEAAVILYLAAYLASLLPRPGKPESLAADPSTVKGILLCTAFFLIGILIDLLKSVPPTSAFVSVPILDFNPIYVICLGLFVAVRALSGPPRGSEPASPAEGSFAVLSPREREVAELIMEGETNGEIAAKLFISESTVKKHVNRIFKKMKVDNRWSLLKAARGDGRIHP